MMVKTTFLLAFTAALGSYCAEPDSPAQLGPGAKIPSFQLPDQNGTIRTFRDIAGPNGAMLVFFRSADW